MCSNNEVCSKDDICDKTLILEAYKAYNCSLQGQTLFGPASVTAQWNMTKGQGAGEGVLSVYIHPQGAPFLFNCTFGGCSVAVGK